MHVFFCLHFLYINSHYIYLHVFFLIIYNRHIWKHYYWTRWTTTPKLWRNIGAQLLIPLPATYSWTLNNNDLGVRGSTLIVPYEDNKDADNGGTYACVASDADSKNFTASVFVALAPYFTGSTQSVQTRAGLSVELTYNVTGFPLPDIIWVKLESNSISKSVTPFSDVTNEVYCRQDYDRVFYWQQ